MACKHVRCYGHGIVHFSAYEHTPWEDVWLRWKTRPNGVRTAGPTLIGRAELESDMSVIREVYASDPRAAQEQWYADESREHERVLAQFEAGASIVVGPPMLAKDGGDISNVYINQRMFNRADAERMLAQYLNERFGVRRVKFSWKRPAAIVVPFCVGAPESV